MDYLKMKDCLLAHQDLLQLADRLAEKMWNMSKRDTRAFLFGFALLLNFFFHSFPDVFIDLVVDLFY
jgi:hypothetical protein